MKSFTSFITAAGMASTVMGHGILTSPQPRIPGTAMEAACGQQVYNNQMGDNYGNIQGELQVAASQTDYNAAECDIWLCKGYKFADNTANVQKYTAGQVVPIKFDVRAPHTGVANMSIVRTADNTVIGAPLISWSVFASNSVPIPASEESFSITIPSDLGSDCATAGDCVIQHFWNAASIDQTYESCIDFTVAGSGSSAPAKSSSSVAAASSMAATSSVATASSTKLAASTTSAVPTTPTAPVMSSSTLEAASSATTASAVESVSSVEPVSSVESAVPVPSSTSSNSVAHATSVVHVTSTYTAAAVSTSEPAAAPTGGCAAAVTITETKTVTETSTLAPDTSSAAVAPASSSIASNAAIVNTSTSTSCTTKITIKSSSTGMPYGYPNSTVPHPTAYPTATGSAVVSPAQLSSIIASMTSALPTGALTATATPTAVPTGYGGAVPTVPSGYSINDLLEWIAYVIGAYDAEEAAPAPAVTSPAAYKRAAVVARGFRG